MVWPTLGSRTNKEPNRTATLKMYDLKMTDKNYGVWNMQDWKMTDKLLANCEHNYVCIFDVSGEH